jgi:sugar lactone lactonase YvrE
MPDETVDGVVVAAVSPAGKMSVIGTMPVENPNSVAVSPDGRFLYYYQEGPTTGLEVASIGDNGLPTPPAVHGAVLHG